MYHLNVCFLEVKNCTVNAEAFVLYVQYMFVVHNERLQSLILESHLSGCFLHYCCTPFKTAWATLLSLALCSAKLLQKWPLLLS